MRRIRLELGLTQQQVAELAGVEYKHLQNIEAGRWPNLTLASVQKIADALRVKPWQLLYDIPAALKVPPARKVRRGR